MGKYPKSKLNDIYSDWHYNILGKQMNGMDCFLCDVDRLWVEVRNKSGEMRIIAVVDIKEPWNTITPTEKAVYDWFISQDMPVYIVNTSEKLEWFSVLNWKTKLITKFTEEEYGNWIKSL